MAYDYSKLRGKIKEAFGTQAAFAKSIGIVPETLTKKLKGKRFFTQKEISAAAEALGLSEADILSCFFTPLV